jgi:N4-gp56 family major capsid protein
MAGQLWGTNSSGGFMYSDQLSDVLRMVLMKSVKFRQLCDVEDFTDKGKGKGDTVHWDVYSDVTVQGTKLQEGTAIPETGFTIQQGTATVDEFGNSVPFTKKLDTMAKHELVPVVKKVLSRDAKKAYDFEAHSKFNATPLRVVGTTGGAIVTTTNGTATATNSFGLSGTYAKKIGDLMKERDIPPYIADDYLCIARPTTLRPFKDDVESVIKYHVEGYDPILNGEIGRYDGVRYIEQTNIGAGVSTNGSAWSVGSSDWAYFMGADTVAEIIVLFEEIRGKIPSDYGRSMGMAWYGLEGFSLIHSASNGLSATNARIIKWDSAV